MKPMYSIFSKNIFLNIIAGIFLYFTLFFLYIGCSNVFQFGMEYYSNENLLGIFFFILFLFFTLWIITSTLLPIIKIDASGVKAYSIFWRKELRWEDIKYARLLKVLQSGRNRLSVSFEGTKTPIKKAALQNKGTRIATYIIISDIPIKNPLPFRTSSLIPHHKIATKHQIAFEFEQKAWQLIEEKLKK